MPMTATLPRLLHGFFHDWLLGQRNISPHTIMSYRDTWRLFLCFVAERRNRPVAKLTVEQITAAEVLAFLQYCEDERRVSIGTRNCRLAALRTFFSFVAAREPLFCRPVCRSLAHPNQTGAAPRPTFSRTRGGTSHPGATGWKHTGRTARSCLSCFAVQHRHTHSGGTQFVSRRRSTNVTCADSCDRQGQERANLPALARNRRYPKGASETPAQRGPRAHLREPLWKSPGRLRGTLQASQVCGSCC